MKSPDALVTPNLLQWARRRAGLEPADVAARLKADTETVMAWESGAAKPTLVSARKLADILRVPFGYFFLAQPPSDSLLIADFRRMGGTPIQEASVDLRDTISDVIAKRDWYSEYTQSQGLPPVPLVGKFTVNDDPAKVGASLRHEVGLRDIAARTSTYQDFTTELVRSIEGIRVLVMRSGIVRSNTKRKLSAPEFRGFAIADDPYAPVIFVNTTDWKAAIVFTLMHELAHVAIGASGISNQSLRDMNADHAIERFCNAVAAEALVPKDVMLEQWANSRTTMQNITTIRRAQRVSDAVVLIRALDLGKISNDEFRGLIGGALDLYEKNNDESGGNPAYTVPARNSRTLTTAVVAEALNENLGYREAAEYLGVRVPTLSKVAEWVDAD